jgi:hypothetical protein
VRDGLLWDLKSGSPETLDMEFWCLKIGYRVRAGLYRMCTEGIRSL